MHYTNTTTVILWKVVVVRLTEFRLLPPGLLSRTIAWTVSSELLGFCFSVFFVSVLCARLGWPSRQLLSARKYRIVSYRCMSTVIVTISAVNWCDDCSAVAVVVRLDAKIVTSSSRRIHVYLEMIYQPAMPAGHAMVHIDGRRKPAAYGDKISIERCHCLCSQASPHGKYDAKTASVPRESVVS